MAAEDVPDWYTEKMKGFHDPPDVEASDTIGAGSSGAGKGKGDKDHDKEESGDSGDEGDKQEEEDPEEPASDDGDMQIIIKKPTSETFVLDVSGTDSTDTVKALIKNRESIPRNQQRLIFGDTQLEDGKKLTDYKIVDGSEIQLVMRIAGGAKRSRGGADDDDEEVKDRHAIPEFFGEVRTNDTDSQSVKDVLGADMKNLRRWLDKLTPQETQELWDDIPKARGMCDQNVRTLVRHHPEYKKIEAEQNRVLTVKAMALYEIKVGLKQVGLEAFRIRVKDALDAKKEQEETDRIKRAVAEARTSSHETSLMGRFFG